MPTPQKFFWYELLATDGRAAADFYRRVIGWNAQDSGIPGVVYTVLSAGTTGIGGIMELTQDMADAGAPPGWTGYVGVDDVDAVAARIAARGGAVLREPADIPGVGRFAVVADPGGAVFQLLKGSSPEGSMPPPPCGPGGVGWHELHAADGADAWAFYSSLFGWTKADAMDMGEHGTYQMFAAGAEPIGGMMTRMPEMPAPCWVFYFNVEAIDAAAKRATDAGAQVVNGPMEVPGGSWIVQCLDPQGAFFAMVAPQR